MTQIEIRPLEPVRGDARQMRYMTYHDLLAMGMTEVEARSIADPDSQESVDNQIKLIRGSETFPKQRLAAVALYQPDHVRAMMVVGSWKPGDELQYIEKAPTLLDKVRLRLELSRTMALLSFVSDPELSTDERMEALIPLMDRLTTQADSEKREIRGSYYAGDFSSPLYFDNGFEIVPDRIGKPIGSIDQQLISRKPLS